VLATLRWNVGGWRLCDGADPWRFDVSKASFRVRAPSRLGRLKLIEFTPATRGALFIPHMERK